MPSNNRPREYAMPVAASLARLVYMHNDRHTANLAQLVMDIARVYGYIRDCEVHEAYRIAREEYEKSIGHM